ncbi:MAG TPA: hypothetical protein ENG83_01335 [Nitrospirae bacterium]|nr:hypothetical protein [Nitrospirota bacterium]HDZ03391.1 hypothetical protein [Nitrospirota bacterium]
MQENRVFTDEELKELVRFEYDRIMECLKDEHMEKGSQLLKDLENRNTGILVSCIDSIAITLGFIQEKLGIGATEEVLRKCSSSDDIQKECGGDNWYYQEHGPDEYMKSWEEEPRRSMFKNLVVEFAGSMRSFMGRGFVSAEEDDEKIIFTLDPCSAGGRMKRQGKYRPPYNWPVSGEPHPLSFGLPDFPVYCQYCAVFHSILPIERSGAIWPVMLPPEKDEDPCTLLFYKDPKDIPEEYYTRVGKEKKWPKK